MCAARTNVSHFGTSTYFEAVFVFFIRISLSEVEEQWPVELCFAAFLHDPIRNPQEAQEAAHWWMR
jgi:hypothetical protein